MSPLVTTEGKHAAELASRDQRMNEFEKVLVELGTPIEVPVKHIFTPGLYTREVLMPRGAFIASKIHQTEHPFVISKGTVTVYTDGQGAVTHTAPFTGVTKPGTRRALYIHEDCIWTTFHATKETDLKKIEEEIIFPHESPSFNDMKTLEDVLP